MRCPGVSPRWARGPSFSSAPQAPRNGTDAAAAMDGELEHALHLALMNRGIVITPFHNMMLVCPETTPDHVQLLLEAFNAVLACLCDGSAA